MRYNVIKTKGNKEMEENAVGVRSHKDGDVGAMNLEEFKTKIKYEIDNFVYEK